MKKIGAWIVAEAPILVVVQLIVFYVGYIASYLQYSDDGFVKLLISRCFSLIRLLLAAKSGEVKFYLSGPA